MVKRQVSNENVNHFDDTNNCVADSSNTFEEIDTTLGKNEIEEWLVESENEEEESQSTLFEVGTKFRLKLTEWAISTHPTQHQLKELLKLCNETLPFDLPQDPRTLLCTPRFLSLKTFEDGSEYWHHGLIDPLKLALKKVKSLPEQLSLNINVDGLTLYESSREEFWPILCNIHELKSIEPIVIGIYCGIGIFSLIYQQLCHNFCYSFIKAYLYVSNR